MQIVRYPHPTLRHVSKPLVRVDAEVHRIVRQMFELMYAERGIGLAANQVDLPYRLFVLNLESDPAARAEELVFINPVLSGRKGTVEAEEGCLSLPSLFGPVKRSERVHVEAYNLRGEEVQLDLEGLMARAVQHEHDHLDGILFIDRLSPTHALEIGDRLKSFARDLERQQASGEVPDDAAIAARLIELERLRT